MKNAFKIDDVARFGLYDAVVIGASAGGVEALTRIFEPLGPSFPLPVIVALHISAAAHDFTDVFSRGNRVAKEAEDKEPYQKGIIYFAPPNYHLLIENDRTFSLSVEEPVNYSRPSIDVLFETAARSLGKRVLAVVLTGASADGAVGMRAIVDGGGVGVVQNPITATAATMPEAALRVGRAQMTLTLEEIARLFLMMGRP